MKNSMLRTNLNWTTRGLLHVKLDPVASPQENKFCVVIESFRELHNSPIGSQISRGDRYFILLWGSSWLSSDFSRNQNNHGSSGPYATCIYCGMRVTINPPRAPHSAKIINAFVLHLLLSVWSAKTQRFPIWAPSLTAPSHWVVYEAWDLPCISVRWLFLFVILWWIK